MKVRQNTMFDMLCAYSKLQHFLGRQATSPFMQILSDEARGDLSYFLNILNLEMMIISVDVRIFS